jgi:hypothetical protein
MGHKNISKHSLFRKNDDGNTHFAMEHSSLHFESYVPNKKVRLQQGIREMYQVQSVGRTLVLRQYFRPHTLLGYGKMYTQHWVSLHVKPPSKKPKTYYYLIFTHSKPIHVYTPTFRPVVTLKFPYQFCTSCSVYQEITLWTAHAPIFCTPCNAD